MVRTRWLALCAVVTTLTGVGAFLRVPMWPVPITLQTLFVFLGGGLLPVGWAAAAQLAYLACGLVGLPVFASAAGLAVVLQPTFGYLLAFPLASAAVSWIVRGGRHGGALGPPGWQRLLMGNGVGALLVLGLGVVYLYLNLNVIGHVGLPPRTVLWTGVAVFLPGEAVKVVLAAAVVRRVWKATQR